MDGNWWVTMIYVGVDPGKATGVAVWDTGIEALIHPTGEYDKAGFYKVLDEICLSAAPMQIEFFTINTRTVKTAVDYTALHLIGACDYAAHLCGHEISYTNPSDVKSRFPDAALKKAGLWNRSPHVRDATRHLLFRLVAENLIDARRLLL